MSDQKQEPHQHVWDEVSYELPRMGGHRRIVGWFCINCGEYADGYQSPPTGILLYPKENDDD